MKTTLTWAPAMALVSEEFWGTLAAALVDPLRDDLLQAWWETRTSVFSPDFYNYIDNLRKQEITIGWHRKSGIATLSEIIPEKTTTAF